ncbi:MAG: GNAT family N-acetyltransferase [Candidatus Zixiibacteriota bacterium]|nr:MAG: GNAT family N-acetyltransferase [candidate division Zixibacteria bacterium]
MMRVNKDTWLSADTLRDFLGKTDYRKFARWPRVTEVGVVSFLHDSLQKYGISDRLLLARRADDITAVLAYRDLDWDSNHYGFACANIDYLLIDRAFDPADSARSLDQLLGGFMQHCRENRVRFVSVSVGSWSMPANLALQRFGFRYIQTWIDGIFDDYQRLAHVVPKECCGLIRPEEIAFFREMSAQSYFDGGRFYLDANFDRQKIAAMYARLIDSSYQNDDIMLVYRIDDRPVGLFIFKKVTSYRTFSDLKVAAGRYLIIDPAIRGQNIGCDFFEQALMYLQDKCDLITTGLEIHNLPSLNLHAGLGFRFNCSHNVYHWWSDSL